VVTVFIAVAIFGPLYVLQEFIGYLRDEDATTGLGVGLAVALAVSEFMRY
jgi:hypothetical protein